MKGLSAWFGRFDRFRENYLNPQVGTLAPKQAGRPLDFVLKLGRTSSLLAFSSGGFSARSGAVAGKAERCPKVPPITTVKLFFFRGFNGNTESRYNVLYSKQIVKRF